VEKSGPTDLIGRVEFTILTGRKRPLREAAAEAGIQRTRYALARETETVLAEAADAAIEVLYLQELVELESQLGALAAQAAEIDRGRFNAGVLPYSSVVRIELDAANLELARQATVGRLDLARARLDRAVGRMPSHPISMTGDLSVIPVPPVELGRLLAEARQSRPELAQSQAAAWEAERLLALARAQAKPDIGLGPRMNDVLGATGDRVGARFEVDVPVFDRNQGGIAESAANLRTRCALVDLTELNTLADVAAAYLELRAIQRRLEYFHGHVEPVLQKTEATIRDASAEKVLDPGRTADLLQRLVRMRLEHLELRYLHARLRTRLEILIGRPLDELEGDGEG
jgi:cobalt-zinc-cadmium efflux system outer membrane protein